MVIQITNATNIAFQALKANVTAEQMGKIAAKDNDPNTLTVADFQKSLADEIDNDNTNNLNLSDLAKQNLNVLLQEANRQEANIRAFLTLVSDKAAAEQINNTNSTQPTGLTMQDAITKALSSVQIIG
jgi:predicted neuraminidase